MGDVSAQMPEAMVGIGACSVHWHTDQQYTAVWGSLLLLGSLTLFDGSASSAITKGSAEARSIVCQLPISHLLSVHVLMHHRQHHHALGGKSIDCEPYSVPLTLNTRLIQVLVDLLCLIRGRAKTLDSLGMGPWDNPGINGGLTRCASLLPTRPSSVLI